MNFGAYTTANITYDNLVVVPDDTTNEPVELRDLSKMDQTGDLLSR